jgi:DNA-directed RNA polymerase subunit RPC12/RpoP
MSIREVRCKNCNAKNEVDDNYNIARCEYCDNLIIINEIEYKADLRREGEQILKAQEEIEQLYKEKKKEKNDLIDVIQQNIWNKEVGMLYLYGLGILLIPFGIGVLFLIYVQSIEARIEDKVRRKDVAICEIDKEIVRTNRNAGAKKDELDTINRKLQEFYALTES